MVDLPEAVEGSHPEAEEAGQMATFRDLNLNLQISIKTQVKINLQVIQISPEVDLHREAEALEVSKTEVAVDLTTTPGEVLEEGSTTMKATTIRLETLAALTKEVLATVPEVATQIVEALITIHGEVLKTTFREEDLTIKPAEVLIKVTQLDLMDNLKTVLKTVTVVDLKTVTVVDLTTVTAVALTTN